MRYKEILQTAQRLTVKNPIFWLFGLVLYGGFNLYTVNFFTLFSNGSWKLFFQQPALLVALAIGGIALFFILNIIKIIFIVQVHSLIHREENQVCDLCTKVKAGQLNYGQWIKAVLVASGLTIALSFAVTLAASFIMYSLSADNAPAVIINILIILLITSVLGIWNLFTAYFVVMHGATFSNASKMSLNLLTLKMRNLIEFGFILGVIYAASVFVGNAFILIWHRGGFGVLYYYPFRIAALLGFILWFAVNNTFFNITFLVFFDRLVKSQQAPKRLESRHLQPNVLN